MNRAIRDWWKSQTEFTQLVLASAVVGAVVTLAKGYLPIGMTLDEYEQALKYREIDVSKELKQVPDAKDHHGLEIELKVIQTKLQNSSKNYEEYLTRLKHRIARLEKLRGQVPDELLTKIIDTLKRGDSKKADHLLKQVEIQDDSVNKVASEGVYLRCMIAEDTIRYLEALEHCGNAARLAPDNTFYLYEAGIINYKLANFKKAIEYYELALASDLKTYGEDHPVVAGDRNNLGLVWDSLVSIKKLSITLYWP